VNSLPYVYAALLDVLGYRERLERDRTNGTLDFKDVLESSLQCLTAVNDAEFAYQAISDTIILTCPLRDNFVSFARVLRNVQVSFLRNGLFLRGGITFQRHFRSGVITYSPAYAGAYELETKMAIYPRIVVDHNIVDMFESAGKGLELAHSQLLCECNGVFFLNIIEENNWAELYAKAAEIYRNDAPGMRCVEGVFNKHLWFQEYLFSSKYAKPESPRYIPPIRVWNSSES
jgi:hypothetical protein